MLPILAHADAIKSGLPGQIIPGQIKRVVIIKLDGVPGGLVEKTMAKRDEQTGKSQLPWMEHIFAEGGVRVRNFYARGISLSVPSWSLLDTGEHLQIRGNVEYDRYTLRAYDYLNFFPFYLSYALSHEVDMPGVKVLDQLGIPLLIDRFQYPQVFQSFQLFQRGVRWESLKQGLERRFRSRSPKELFDEWQTGFEMRPTVTNQMEHELIGHLSDPRIRYLDYYSGEFDHVAHLTNDSAAQRNVLQRIDALIGRIWTAIQASPLGPETALFVVSDHGMNSEEGIYSQGYNLIDLLRSAAAGGHHVVTNRFPMEEFKLRGLDPFVSNVVSESAQSYYLKDQQAQYPTALLDLDGNERANIYFRNSDLNVLQLLLQQIARSGTPPAMRRAAGQAVLAVVERHRAAWQTEIDGLNQELAAVREKIKAEEPVVDAFPKRWSKAAKAAGDDKKARRLASQLESWRAEQRGYVGYIHAISGLLSLTAERLNSGRFHLEELIPPRAMGDRNTIGQLQNYVIALSAAGLQLRPDGSLDMESSFHRVNYFSLLRSVKVRNDVQSTVGSHPIDWIAERIPGAVAARSLPEEGPPLDDAVWIYAGDAQQLVILSRVVDGVRQLRCLPVASLREDADGTLRFTRVEWRDGLPLHLWEDPNMVVPLAERPAWLAGWHTEREWLRATHLTEYSNAVIGLYEELSRNDEPRDEQPKDAPNLLKRYALRKRRLVEADMLVLASNHWNFNARGFNPGGNHGSFFRISTHSTLMIAGGRDSGIPRGLTVEEPYDSLSFVPTILALLGRSAEAAKLPGPVIPEVLRSAR